MVISFEESQQFILLFIVVEPYLLKKLDSPQLVKFSKLLWKTMPLKQSRNLIVVSLVTIHIFTL